MKYSLVFRLINYIFRLSLLGLALTAAGVMTFGTPDTVKQALRDSGAYGEAASQLAERASQEAASVTGPVLENARVESAAKASISPVLLQKDIEGAIDSTYSWLQGDSPELKVSIDLKPYINGFTDQLGDQAVQSAETLPNCTVQQLQQVDLSHIDAFNLPCRPAGLNLDTLKNQAISQLTKSNELLSDPVIGTSSLPKDDQGQTALDRAKDVPQVFHLTMLLPWVFVAAVVLSGGLMLLLSRSDYRSGLRRLMRSTLGAGVTVLLFVGIAKLFFWYATRPDGAFSRLVAGNFSDVILSFARSLEQVYDSRLLVFGVVYIAVGIIGIIGLRFIKAGRGRVGDAAEKTGSEPTTTRPGPGQPSAALAATPKAPTTLSDNRRISDFSTAPTPSPTTPSSAPPLPSKAPATSQVPETNPATTTSRTRTPYLRGRTTKRKLIDM